MKHRLFAFALAMAAVAVTASAQGPQGQPGRNPGPPPADGVCTTLPLDLAKLQVVEGPITLLDLGQGVQYPSIVVNKLQIKVAPVWFLLDNDFELATGDQVRINAAPSTTPGDAYLYALDITRTATGAKLTLRDATGQPLWRAANRRRSGEGNPDAPRNGESCFDPASVKIASGVAETVTAGLGIRQPVLVLKSGDTLLTIRIGPERVLLDADFEVKAGMNLTVKYGLATCSDEFVALELTDVVGRRIILRDQDGSPLWSR
jgi:hypothetical protein